MRYPFDSLPENLAAFCAFLRRDYQFQTGPGELRDAARALELAELGDVGAVRNVLRPVLAGRLEDARVFDPAFDRFFGLVPETGQPEEGPFAWTGTNRKEQSRTARPVTQADDALSGEDAAAARTDHGVSHVAEAGIDSAAGLLRSSYSAVKAEGASAILEQVDRAWRDAAAIFVNRVHAGLSRRWRPAPKGRRFDLRRTLRTSLPTGGDVVTPRWRARLRRRPRIVVLVDGSRSMEPYVRAALRMAVALADASLNTEVFTFSTALRRVTRDVRRAAVGQSWRVHLEDAWGGGTTIGVCLREFLQTSGERLLGRDTVVMIVSDGLDVGDVDVLRSAMAALSRQSAAIIWLNPLIDTPGYAPTALGMSVARPFVTTLASVREPADLIRLARIVRVR